MDYNRAIGRLIESKRMLNEAEERIKLNPDFDSTMCEMILNTGKYNLEKRKEDCFKSLSNFTMIWTPKMEEYIENIIQLQDLCKKPNRMNDSIYSIVKSKLSVIIEEEKDKLRKEIESNPRN